MKIIAGLGNPGRQYELTKHNAGFIILDNFILQKSLVWEFNSKVNAAICKFENVLLVKPQTFMNNSGTCISNVLSYFNTQPNQLLVIHDDVDLEFEKVKKTRGSSSAGHHGVEDIIQKLGTNDFWRLRIGVGRPQANNFDVEEWVLSQFSAKELEFIQSIEVPLNF